jgi:DNA-binding response OmpR family regulator
LQHEERVMIAAGRRSYTEPMSLPGKRLLLLEDDAATASAVAEGFDSLGFDVSSAAEVGDALALVRSRTFDAAILDLMVPGGSGYLVLQALREQDARVPVLVISARDRLEDRVEGLDRGADDYLVKPFAFTELAARVRALLRRPASNVAPIRAGVIEVDPLRRLARCGGRALDLTAKEFELLACLVARQGEVLSRKEILRLVWGYDFDPGTNVVDVHVNRLRRKLESAQAMGVLCTVRGVGYVLRG